MSNAACNPVISSFWHRLTRPFTVLAPMEDVTDTVFRRMVLSCGRPDVVMTEFVSADGLCSRGRDKVIHRLRFTPQEGPIVAQIWGNIPEHYEETARLIVELGFDGIDINMGCPVPKIVKNGACSALIENTTLAKELICAAKEGAGSLPVSVKTRIGLKRPKTEEWASFLLDQNPAVITVHGRTAKQQSEGNANWDEIGKVAALREHRGSETLIIGNGDIHSYDQFAEYHQRYGVDGIMVGRGIFSNPFIFCPDAPPLQQRSREEKLTLFKNHFDLFYATWRDTKDFGILKKFAKVYVTGFSGASQLRSTLVESQSADEFAAVLTDAIEHGL